MNTRCNQFISKGSWLERIQKRYQNCRQVVIELIINSTS